MRGQGYGRAGWEEQGDGMAWWTEDREMGRESGSCKTKNIRGLAFPNLN